MVDPTTLAEIGWGMSAASWLISPIVGRLLNKCFDALGLDPRFQSRKKALDDKLELLQTTLLPQLLILTDAAQKCPHRRELEVWLQKLKSAYYEAEYLLGLVEYKRLEKEVNSLFPPASKFNFRFNFSEMKVRKNNLLKGLENLEKVVNEAMKFIDLLNLKASSVNSSVLKSTAQSRETLSTPAFTVIGRDSDRNHILKLLHDDFPECSECYSVIGIWGMGGSGKTTLAQYVCEYEKKNNYFDLVIWTHVSQNFELRSIFKRIWESAFQEDCPNCDSIEGLSSRLQEKLRGKRFFLVLDDVWCDKDVSVLELEQLFAPLQRCKRGSKILVTTRIEEAAKTLGAIDPIPLRQLEHDEFLDLFMSRALYDLQNSEKYLKERLTVVGVQIANKLHRSPLAAATVAAQLRRRRDPDFWLSMLNENLLNAMMGALFLSYQNLSLPLQRCFVFLSLFPKGYKFSQRHLVGLWIGEDFIETDGSNRHVGDIANDYMLELISSSFLQVNKTEWGGTEYSVHDLLHDLAEKVSKGECFRIERDEKRDIPIQTRHLYVDAYMFEEYIRKICKLKDLRTIIIGKSWEATLKKKDLNALFKVSKKFYMVDFCFNSIDGLPEYMFYLENLRYLDYNSPDVMDSPKSSTGLYQLRLLHTPRDIQIFNIGRLTLLQDMPMFQVSKERGCGLEQLEHLSGLYGNLSIDGLVNVNSSEEARRVKLSEKTGLRELQLDWKNDPRRRINVIFEDLHSPTQIRDAEVILDELCPPPQIEKLTIHNYSGQRYPKWFPEYNKNTTHLKELELFNCPFLEALPETNNLIHLQSLTIYMLPELKWWASLPSNLVYLGLYGCSSLAFLSEEDLKIRMSTRSGKQSPVDDELEKLVDSNIYHRYLDKQKELDRICQLKKVNGELYLPLKLEELAMASCFITAKILASSLKGHTSLTRLDLRDIITISCIPREVLSSLPKLRVFIIRRCLMLTSVGGLNTLSSLEELNITCCPCLTIEPPVVASSNILKKVKVSYFKPLDDMLQALNFVQTLDIRDCPTIQSLDFSNLNSLSDLWLGDCSNLVSLRGLNDLNNIENFTVVGCGKLECSSEASKLPGVRRNLTISKLSILELVSRDGLASLDSLTVNRAEQECFTQEECEMLSHLSSLETIAFEYCKMRSLPDLSCHGSLTRLEIFSCKDLTSLSELPPSVQSISISHCNPEFTMSCKETNNPNWQKISDISDKYIY